MAQNKSALSTKGTLTGLNHFAKVFVWDKETSSGS
jgi:hypothetical protein